MSQTIILAETVDADVTADVVVGATPVTVTLYSTEEAPVGADCQVLRKVGSFYQSEPGPRGPVLMSLESPVVVLYAPGTYQISKPATSSTIGFAKDEA